jgi:CrcB protein
MSGLAVSFETAALRPPQDDGDGLSVPLRSNIVMLECGWSHRPKRGKLAMNYLLVFIGGGIGSSLRHTVNVVCPRLFGTAFPYHTFIINITGSIVMGLIAGYLAFKGDAAQSWRLFLMTGILGGYTTFSAFSLDAAALYERGEIGLSLLYVLGSVVLSILGLFAGLALVRQLA